MKILFLIPKKNNRSILPAPDIGLAYVARAALNAGANVKILDAHKDNIDPEKFSDFLKDNSFDLIGIKCLSIDLINALEYFKFIKEHNQSIKTVMGGPHPTALPEQTINSPYLDYIIKGEGETGIFSLVKNLILFNGNIPLEKKDKIPSLVYKNGMHIFSNPQRFENDPDETGFPAWHLFDIKNYPQLPGSGGSFLPILTSRGCPSKCTFCCIHDIHGREVRTRSLEKVIDEIKWLIQEFNIQKVSIFDDNFTFYKNHAIEFCNLFVKNNFSIKFDIPQGIRINKIDEDIIFALKKAGCTYIGIGIESGSQKTLNTVCKGLTIETIIEKINLIRKYTQIRLIGFFIIGFPHETALDIQKTIFFALKLPLDYATFTIFTPFPGTTLFKQMINEGYFFIDTFNWEELLLDKPTFTHKMLTHDKLKNLQRKAYLKFYFRPSKIGFFFRIIFKEGSFVSYFKRFLSIIKK